MSSSFSTVTLVLALMSVTCMMLPLAFCLVVALSPKIDLDRLERAAEVLRRLPMLRPVKLHLHRHTDPKEVRRPSGDHG